MPNHSFHKQQNLIDAIFHQQDQQLREAFRERIARMDRREQLASVSGIRDEAVLARLIELDITAETLAGLEVVPLVFVAWADGGVQAKEREVIMALAKAAGIPQQDGRYPLLERWLKKRPNATMLEAWKHYVKGLCQQLDPPEVEKLRQGVVGRARQVAQATGGFLGFGEKVSSAEQSTLGELAKAFA